MDSLDSEILAVRAQIDALRQRRSLLSATLLSSTRMHSVLKKSAATNPRVDQRKLQYAVNVAEERTMTVRASVRRATCGLTAFRAVDPDPHAPHGGQVIGIRLDVYRSKAHSFDSPYFLLFRRLEDGHLKLHQHTIPAFVPVRSLLQRYMSISSDNYSTRPRKSSRQNLAAFVRGVRRELVAAARRKDAISAVEDVIASAQGRFSVKAVEQVDPSARNLQLRLRDGSILRLRLAFSGEIEKCGVGNAEPSDLQSKTILERALSQYNEHITELPDRLSSVQT